MKPSHLSLLQKTPHSSLRQRFGGTFHCKLLMRLATHVLKSGAGAKAANNYNHLIISATDPTSNT
jgi:hypothetical protein